MRVNKLKIIMNCEKKVLILVIKNEDLKYSISEEKQYLICFKLSMIIFTSAVPINHLNSPIYDYIFKCNKSI